MITCSNIVAQGADYLTRHLSSNDYYSEGESIVGTWFGAGCERLGLAPGSAVSKEDFAAIGDNRKPDGSKLTASHMPDRKSWTDVQVSAPKDVSILAVVAGDERLTAAFGEAAHAAMEAMQTYAGTRERRGALHGSEETRLTRNIVAAEYGHDTSRALDPQMHKHFVVANATWDEESGRWMALQSRDMMLASKFARRVLYDHLAASCERMGYRVTDESGDGFRIEGVTDAMREKFSQREAQIDVAAKAFEVLHGREPSNKERAVLTRESRDKKLREISTAEVREYQRSRLAPAEEKALAGLVASAAVEPAAAPAAPLPSPVDLDARLDGALRHATERNSVVREWEALEAVFAHKSAGVRLDAAAVSARLAERTTGPDADLHTGLGSRLTTAHAAREEADTVRLALAGRGACAPLAALESLQAAQTEAEATPGAARLADDQLAAARLLAGNQDRVACLLGDAGTGKTFLLQRLRDSSSQPWIALGPTARARDELKENGFKEAETVAAFLKNPAKQADARGGVLLVDEAGLLDMTQMKSLLEVAAANDARVLYVGDPKQHNAVGRGDALRAVLDAARHEVQADTVKPANLQPANETPTPEDHRPGLCVARLQTVRRQTSEAHREVSDLLARGQVEEALDRQVNELKTVEEVKNEKQLFSSAADHYMERREALAAARNGPPGRSPDLLGICRTWEDIGRFSGEIRDRMKERGQLGADRATQIVQPAGWTAEEKKVASRYEPGKHVVTFQGRVESINAKAGENWAVEAADADGLTLRRMDEAAPRQGQRRQPSAQSQKIGWDDLQGAEVGEKREIALAPGDLIQFRANCRDGKKAVANNGDVRAIKSIGKDGRLNLIGGGQVPAAFKNFCHGYAVTSHKSQGASVRETVVVLGAAACASAEVQGNYVAHTRHKENSRVFVADLEGMRSSLVRSAARGPGRELVAEMPVSTSRKAKAEPRKPGAAVAAPVVAAAPEKKEAPALAPGATPAAPATVQTPPTNPANPYALDADDGKGIAPWEVGREVGGDGLRRNDVDRLTHSPRKEPPAAPARPVPSPAPVAAAQKPGSPVGSTDRKVSPAGAVEDGALRPMAVAPEAPALVKPAAAPSFFGPVVAKQPKIESHLRESENKPGAAVPLVKLSAKEQASVDHARSRAALAAERSRLAGGSPAPTVAAAPVAAVKPAASVPARAAKPAPVAATAKPASFFGVMSSTARKIADAADVRGLLSKLNAKRVSAKKAKPAAAVKPAAPVAVAVAPVVAPVVPKPAKPRAAVVKPAAPVKAPAPAKPAKIKLPRLVIDEPEPAKLQQKQALRIK